jgi:glucose-1-phosphate adenylyltransferase
MTTDDKGRITEFAEKPEHPNSTQASMGVYIFSTDALIKYLEQDEADPDSENDFGKNVIPAMLADGQRMFAHLFKGYWRDVGTLSSFWATNMDALGAFPELVLNDPGWRIYYRHSFNHPQYVGEKADITYSICGSGNEVNGRIEESVIFNNITVEDDAKITGSIIMSNCVIGKNAEIEYAIVDSNAVIAPGVKIKGDRSKDPVVIEHGSTVTEDIIEG